MTQDKDRTTPNETKEIIEQGAAALKRVLKRAKLDFMDWIKIGLGIREGAWMVAQKLRMNSPDSKSQIFS